MIDFLHASINSSIMKKILIAGAGGLGRELLEWIKDINEVSLTWEIKGFLNDEPTALDSYDCEYGIIGTIKDWIPSEDEVFVCGVSSPMGKDKIVNTLRNKGAKFETIIHPSTIIGDSVHIGEGTVIAPRSLLTTNVRVGSFVTFLSSDAGHDSTIGDFSTLSGKCSINGHVEIGQRVYLGNGSLIYPGKKVGDDAFIGIGSVVINNVKAGTRVFGNPAKRIYL